MRAATQPSQSIRPERSPQSASAHAADLAADGASGHATTLAQGETELPGEEVVQTDCDLCGEPAERYGKAPDHDLLRCPRCGLIWSNPLLRPCTPPTEDHEHYWGEDVYRANGDPQRQRFASQLRLFLRKARFDLARPLEVLEVGSGFGFFLDVCENLGLRAEGCDVSARAVDYANRKRPRVRLGTLDGAYADASFDAVFAFNLIEHLPHPRAFLEQAYRVLRPGGVLALETPIQESLMHRLARAGDLLSGGRLTYYGLNPGGHIYKFSTRTFATCAPELGFERLYQCNVSSPFGEIWGKSTLADFGNRSMYRSVLPLAWLLGAASGQGNRLFVLLRKVGCALVQTMSGPKADLADEDSRVALTATG